MSEIISNTNKQNDRDSTRTTVRTKYTTNSISSTEFASESVNATATDLINKCKII